MSTEKLTSEPKILTLTKRVRRESVCDEPEKVWKKFEKRRKYSKIRFTFEGEPQA